MKTHIAYFDVLRVIAILAVITLHATGSYTDVFSYNWEVSNVWKSLTRWGVPVFVMISGALFLDPKREIGFRKLYLKNILHIVTILIFWSIGYACLGFVTGSSKGDVEKLLGHLILGHFHLWFLFMLVGLYMIVPLLRPICADKKLLRYFLLLSIFFTFLIPTIVKILMGFDLILPNAVPARALEAISRLTGQTHFHFTLGYVAYFVLGYYMHQISLSSNQRKIIYLLGVLGWVFSLLFCRFISQIAKSPFDFYSGGNITLYVLFESLAIFVFVKCHIDMLSANVLAVFNYLSKRVLGIYLVHSAVQSALSSLFGISRDLFNPLFSIPFVALLVFCLSWVVTEIIRKIPWLGKKII